jgi:uncharacterized protein HemY
MGMKSNKLKHILLFALSILILLLLVYIISSPTTKTQYDLQLDDTIYPPPEGVKVNVYFVIVMATVILFVIFLFVETLYKITRLLTKTIISRHIKK